MMFASKTPRDLNHDPTPVVIDIRGNGMRVATADPILGQWWAESARHDPRPEFDHVQHNEPNRILALLRTIDAECDEYAAWVRDFNQHPGFWTRTYTQAEIDHARRVLTRIPRITEVAS